MKTRARKGTTVKAVKVERKGAAARRTRKGRPLLKLAIAKRLLGNRRKAA